VSQPPHASGDAALAGGGPGVALRGSGAVHQGPGDLTLTSIVLFTLGAYGVAAGAATGQQAVVAVGVFAFTLFGVGIVWPIVSLARLSVSAVAPTDATVGDALELRIEIGGRAARLDVRALDPSGTWWRTSAPRPRRSVYSSGPERCACVWPRRSSSRRARASPPRCYTPSPTRFSPSAHRS
jgi:hypothetical protein